jgi:glycosyltransferase involved in cell wall biosynthesis
VRDIGIARDHPVACPVPLLVFDEVGSRPPRVTSVADHKGDWRGQGARLVRAFGARAMNITDPTYSIVVPIKDEEGALPELADRLRAVMARLDGPAEVLLVDDGSIDNSYTIITELARADPRFKGIKLSRNFGHQSALTAGIDAASGSAVVTMDADLQHPPETILDMAAKWRAGFDVVYGVAAPGGPQGILKGQSSRLFYKLLQRSSSIDVVTGAGDFRLADRRVVDVVRLMPERNRYLRGMFSWVGYQQTGVQYTCGRRVAGTSKYTLRRMVGLAADGIVGFSTLPLRMLLLLGFVVSLLSILFGIAAIVVKIASVFAVPGWASLVVVTSFLGGMQLFVLGVIGEYIGHIYDEVKARPTYVIEESIGDNMPGVAATFRHSRNDGARHIPHGD